MADDTARAAPSHGFGYDGADLLALASQRLEDFGGALTEFANRYWILGAGGKAREIIEALSGIFTLSETLRDAIRYRLPRPGKDGAPALFIANDGRGRFEQLVVNTPRPAELWALRTTSRSSPKPLRSSRIWAKIHARISGNPGAERTGLPPQRKHSLPTKWMAGACPAQRARRPDRSRRRGCRWWKRRDGRGAQRRRRPPCPNSPIPIL